MIVEISFEPCIKVLFALSKNSREQYIWSGRKLSGDYIGGYPQHIQQQLEGGLEFFRMPHSTGTKPRRSAPSIDLVLCSRAFFFRFAKKFFLQTLYLSELLPLFETAKGFAEIDQAM